MARKNLDLKKLKTGDIITHHFYGSCSVDSIRFDDTWIEINVKLPRRISKLDKRVVWNTFTNYGWGFIPPNLSEVFQYYTNSLGISKDER